MAAVARHVPAVQAATGHTTFALPPHASTGTGTIKHACTHRSFTTLRSAGPKRFLMEQPQKAFEPNMRRVYIFNNASIFGTTR